MPLQPTAPITLPSTVIGTPPATAATPSDSAPWLPEAKVGEHFRRAPEPGRGLGLLNGHVDAAQLDVVHPVKQNQRSTRVDDRDGHVPTVFPRLGFGGGDHGLRGFETDNFSID
jgi:hypothetical protein